MSVHIQHKQEYYHAEATANILTGEGYENKIYSFSNTENVSFRDVVNIIGELSGKKISYNSPGGEIYIDTLSKAGVSKDFVEMFAGFGEAIKQGEFNTSKTDLENLLGRNPVSVKEVLTEAYSKN